MLYRLVYLLRELESVTTRVEIEGIVVHVYESIYDYASQNAGFSNYPDEMMDVSRFSEKEESKLPKVLIRQIFLYKDLNFSVGKQIFGDVEFPEITEVDGSEYILVNFGERGISYLKADAMDKPVYCLIYRIEKVTTGMYLYRYPANTEIFETGETAQAKADELNKKLGNITINNFRMSYQSPYIFPIFKKETPRAGK